MEGKSPSMNYDGYTSCPLVTGYSKCILAEFDYDGNPLETLPINQAKERRTSFIMKKDLMPTLYWKLMLKYVAYALVIGTAKISNTYFYSGLWNGPKPIRKILHLGASR